LGCDAACGQILQSGKWRGSTEASSSAQPNAWIEEHIAKVGQQLRGYGHDNGDERACLKQVGILVQGCIKDQSAEAFVGKEGFHHDHTGQQPVELQEYHREW